MTDREMLELPKQWRHWCRKAGLRPTYGGRRHYDWSYLKGRGRFWRLNCHGMFQCGDTYAEFDRWALCKIAELPCPKSELQFIDAVRALLANQRAAAIGSKL